MTKKEIKEGFEDQTRYTLNCGMEVPECTKIARLVEFQGERFGFFGTTKKEKINFAYSNCELLSKHDV